MRASLPSPRMSWAGTIGIARRDGARAVPTDRRVVVVGAGVDELPLAVVPGEVRVARVAVERELEDRHPRQLELVAEPLDGRRDHSQILGDDRQRAEIGPDGPEQLAAGRATPAARARGLPAGRDRPVCDQAAKVIEPDEVDELERSPEALDPPAESG